MKKRRLISDQDDEPRDWLIRYSICKKNSNQIMLPQEVQEDLKERTGGQRGRDK